MTTALLEPGPAATGADSTLVVAASLDAATARAPRSWWLIAPVLALSATLNSWALTSVGWGNGYYSAAVHSMSKSWKAFLFAGFDRAGFVTVDKPPFSLWVQTLSVRVFGFSKPAILIPQLVGGTLAVWLVYLTVARVWGRGAGLVGALALAVTPINVMVNHSNNTDATLVLLMTLAAYLAVRASTSGSLRWLVLACAVAGTAMTAKMLAAVPVMPGILLAYGWCAPLGWRRRLRDVTIGLVTLAVAGLWWFTLVDLWPKDSRPFVGSSKTNSAYQLAFERNGVNQVEGGGPFGGGGGPGGGGGGPGGRRFPGGFGGFPPGNNPAPGLGQLLPGLPSAAPVLAGVAVPGRGSATNRGATDPASGSASIGNGAPDAIPPSFPRGLPGRGFGGAGGPGGRGFAGGQPGVGRLFNSDLGGQAGWLLLPALLGGLAVLVASRLRPSPRLASALVLGPWLVGAGLIFSITKGIVHPYYLASLGPPISGLVGIGVALLAAGLRAGKWRYLALAIVAATLTTVAAVVLLRREARTRGWAVVLALVMLAGGVALIVHRMITRKNSRGGPPARARGGQAIPLVLMVVAATGAPFVWTRASLAAGFGANLPYASPSGATFGGPGGFNTPDPALIAYLKANRHGERFFVATSSAMSAESIVIETGEAVMALGGFSGSDPVLTETALRSKISTGEVRFFMLGGFGPFGGGGGASSFVSTECTTVAAFSQLSDCANLLDKSPKQP